MKEPIQSLLAVLQDDQRIFVNGQLMKNKIMELAIKNDENLIKRLLSEEHLRSLFFMKSGEVYVFLRDKFVKFIGSKEFLPNSYTMFRNKIGLAVGDELLKDKNDVVLNFPYKDCVLEGGQDKEDAKRDEVFYNEILASAEIDRLLDPKVFANVKRYTVDGIEEDVEWSDKDNLIIKGNNLMALHSIKNRFAGSVKFIYIDPPYNKEDDSFQYNDKFNHSTWLTFMKNRLEVAKELLRDDGVIAIQIDNKEFAYLKILMDEIFGENELSTITVKVKDTAGTGQDSYLFDVCEYILLYAKDKKKARESLKPAVEYFPLEEPIKNYDNHILDYGEPVFYKEIERKNVGKIKIYTCKGAKITKFKGDFKEYLAQREHIAADYNPSGGMIKAIRNELPKTGLSYIEYVPTRGKNAGKQTKVYFINARILSFVSDITEEIDGVVYKRERISNLWEFPNAGLHLEGGVQFTNGKNLKN